MIPASMSPVRFRFFMRIVFVVSIAILLILAGFEYLPMTTSGTSTVLDLVSNQQWVVERIAKDVLLLQETEGTAPTTRIQDQQQAVNELQNELPYWEANNTQLTTAMLPVTIKVVFTDAQIAFIDINKAASSVLASPTIPHPLESAIIIQQERPFFLDYAQMHATLLQSLTTGASVLFGIEMFFEAILFLVLLLVLIRIERSIRLILQQQQIEASPDPPTSGQLLTP